MSSASGLQEFVGDKRLKVLLPSVSASLVLAAGVGIAEAVALSIGSGFLMNIMGIPVVRQTLLIMFGSYNCGTYCIIGCA